MLTFRFTLAVALSIAVLTARADAATLSLVSDNIQLFASNGATFFTNPGQSLIFAPLITGNYQFTLFPDLGDPVPPMPPAAPRLFFQTTATITGIPGFGEAPLGANPNGAFFFQYTPAGSVTTVTPMIMNNSLALGVGTYTLNFSTFVSGSAGVGVPVTGSFTINKSATFTVVAVPEPSPLPGILLLGGIIVVLQRRRKLNQA